MAKATKKTTERGRKKTVKTETTRVPTREEIGKRAYDIYLSRGGAPGSQMDDWLAAERQLEGGL
jgi:hypothetical protein